PGRSALTGGEDLLVPTGQACGVDRVSELISPVDVEAGHCHPGRRQSAGVPGLASWSCLNVPCGSCTIWYTREECRLMSALHVEAEQSAQATPGIIWALMSDATTYPRWGPWSEAGYRRPGDTSPRGPGAVYWLRSSRRFGLRRPVSVEKILDAEDGRRLAYTV